METTAVDRERHQNVWPRRSARASENSSSPRSIVFLITQLCFGGAETQMIRLALELKSAGWNVTVVCLLDPVAYTSVLENSGISVISLGMPRGVPDPRGLLRLARLLRQLKPDVLHTHLVHANLCGRVARLLAPVPVTISTVHNLYEVSESGGVTWHKELLYRLTDFLADRTTIIAQSAFDRYVRVGAVPLAKLEMIPNGVDTHRFQPSPVLRERTRAELGLGNSFVWLAIGRLVEQKNYPNLLRAAQTLTSKDWKILLVGEGNLRDSLSALAMDLGIQDRVQLVPAREDVVALYSAADAFVMSSAWEGMSAALQEALSMSLPCVVTDVGANRDLVRDGVTGYVVPPGDFHRLAIAMDSLMNAPVSQREQFGRNARDFAVSQYEFATVAQRWFDLYERCLEKKAIKH